MLKSKVFRRGVKSAKKPFLLIFCRFFDNIKKSKIGHFSADGDFGAAAADEYFQKQKKKAVFSGYFLKTMIC